MLADQLDPDDSFDIQYLAHYLTDNDILFMPTALAFLNVYWSGLNIAHKANLLCGLKEYSIPLATNGPVVIDRPVINQIIAALGFESIDKLESNELLAKQFAETGQWDQAWLIASLDASTKKSYTRIEWQRHMSLEISRSRQQLNRYRHV